MSSLAAATARTETIISAVVTRADGRVEDLGVIHYWHRNPLRRLWWQITHKGA